MSEVKTGIDPSFRGFCLSTFDDKKLIDFCFIHTNKLNNIMSRILVVSLIAEKYLIRNKIKQANIETPYFNRINPKTYSQQMRLYQQVLYILDINGITYMEFTPTNIKEIIGHGKYTKKEMREVMLKKYNFLNKINLKEFSEKELEGLFDSIAIGLAFKK